MKTMNKKEEQRINKFITNVLNSDKRMATQLPGNEEYTIIIPIEAITEEWQAMVKDLEELKDGEEK